MDSTGWVVQGVLLAAPSRWQYFGWMLALVATLLAGAFIILLVERYRKRSPDAGPKAGDQLSHFRELYERGTISKEEFDKIRAQLMGDVRKEQNLGPSPASAPTHSAKAPTVTEPPPDGQPPAS
jgi:uncharacterized membrane protein